MNQNKSSYTALPMLPTEKRLFDEMMARREPKPAAAFDQHTDGDLTAISDLRINIGPDGESFTTPPVATDEAEVCHGCGLGTVNMPSWCEHCPRRKNNPTIGEGLPPSVSAARAVEGPIKRVNPIEFKA